MLQTVDLNILAICFVVTFMLVWPAVWIFRQLAPIVGLLDVPNLRSSHVGAIPVAGGAVFVLIVPIVSLVVARQTGISLGREENSFIKINLSHAQVKPVRTEHPKQSFDHG